MPNYSYMCSRCLLRREAHRHVEDRDKPLHCNRCGDQLERQITAPGFVINGYSEENGYSDAKQGTS